MKPRPTKAKPGDKPVPVKPRAMNAGVLMFQPTTADKLKIAMGYAIRVHVKQMFQHNPGRIEVSADWEVVEHTAMKETPRIQVLQQPATQPSEKNG
jgi:hypothetical protein